MTPANEPEGRTNDPIVVHLDSDLESIIPTFLQNQVEVIQVLRTALEAGNYETLETRGHSMRGYGGGYGFQALTDYGAALERAAQDRDVETVRQLIERIANYMDRVEIVYTDDD